MFRVDPNAVVIRFQICIFDILNTAYYGFVINSNVL